MFKDCRENIVTAQCEAAVLSLDEAVSDYARFGVNAGKHLKQALGHDPDFAMAHCLKGYFFKMFSVPALEIKAAQCGETAVSLCASQGATERERMHACALVAWASGDMRRATTLWEDILRSHPRDFLALKLAHFTHFYMGASTEIRDSVGRVLEHWDETVPEYSYLLGMYAFGLEESAQYEAAERTGREAVGLQPNDPWAIHAVTHVLEMQDRRRDGIEWLTSLEGHWSDGSNFIYHVWWHLALMHLEEEDVPSVLNIYDTRIRSEQTDEYLDISNATSLLWRLGERGVDVGNRWQELAERSRSHTNENLLVFADVHYALALGACSDAGALRTLISSMEDAAKQKGVTQAEVYSQAGIPVCRAIEAWYKEDYDTAVEGIVPVLNQIKTIGGSHAQRDVFRQLAVSAALKSGRFDVAQSLLEQRMKERPNNLWGWKRLSAAHDGLGDVAAADRARETARSLVG